MSQNKKRKKKPVAADAGQTVTAAKTAAQLKKEKKAEAERIKKENQTKRKRCYAASVVVAFLAVVLSFWSGSFYRAAYLRLVTGIVLCADGSLRRYYDGRFPFGKNWRKRNSACTRRVSCL